MERVAKRRIGCLLIIVLMIVAGAFVGRWYYKEYAFWTLRSRVQDRIDALSEDRPANLSREQWNQAVAMARTALANVWPLDSNTHAGLEAFAARLEQKIAAGDSLATVRWIWDELEKTTGRTNYVVACMPVQSMNPWPVTEESLADYWGLERCGELNLCGGLSSSELRFRPLPLMPRIGGCCWVLHTLIGQVFQ